MIATSPPEPVSRTSSDAPLPPLRLDFLDGLRGLAALYVVLYHASHEPWIKDGIPGPLYKAVQVLSYGHFAVAVFIVLSGYCLMLPVVRSGDGELRGGVVQYIQRRAWRILPPYYISLLMVLAFIALIPALRDPGDSLFAGAVPAFTAQAIIPHLLVVHNLDADWIWKINPPAWSVATEWQIYFIFPALLLPVWRRLGVGACIGVAFAVGLAPHFLLDGWLDGAAPWYLGLFAMGMVGAVIGFSEQPLERRLRESVPWWRLSLVLTAALVATLVVADDWWWDHLWFADPQVGLTTVSLIVACTLFISRGRGGARTPALAVLEAAPAVRLGAFSYSLYLAHLPVLSIASIAMRDAGVDPTVGLAVMLLAVVPTAVAFSYGFHVAFERRFMPGRVRNERQATQAAILSPAP